MTTPDDPPGPPPPTPPGSQDDGFPAPTPVQLEDAAIADEIFTILMGENVEYRRNFIQRNAKDVRFLDI